MKFTTDLWAVVNSFGHVTWTQGGSSTPSKLMVYDSQKKAELALSRGFRYSKAHQLHVEKIYQSDSITPEQK